MNCAAGSASATRRPSRRATDSSPAPRATHPYHGGLGMPCSSYFSRGRAKVTSTQSSFAAPRGSPFRLRRERQEPLGRSRSLLRTFHSASGRDEHPDGDAQSTSRSVTMRPHFAASLARERPSRLGGALRLRPKDGTIVATTSVKRLFRMVDLLSPSRGGNPQLSLAPDSGPSARGVSHRSDGRSWLSACLRKTGTLPRRQRVN